MKVEIRDATKCSTIHSTTKNYLAPSSNTVLGYDREVDLFNDISVPTNSLGPTQEI